MALPLSSKHAWQRFKRNKGVKLNGTGEFAIFGRKWTATQWANPNPTESMVKTGTVPGCDPCTNQFIQTTILPRVGSRERSRIASSSDSLQRWVAEFRVRWS
jgi:hypothetical protein